MCIILKHIMFHVKIGFLSSGYNYPVKSEQKGLPAFSRNLKRIRKAAGLSQYDLAERTGISQRMIYHYENFVSEPPLSKISVIAKALNVKVSDILQEIDDANEVVGAAMFDTRSLKKLQDILSLPQNDRADLYRMLNRMLRENRLKQEIKDQPVDSMA